MASCVRCGRHPLRKDSRGVFACRRCGPRPSSLAAVRQREADQAAAQ